MPARSTVDSGMASTRSTNSSRSSASTRSPSRAEANVREPHQHRLRDHERRRSPARSGRPSTAVVPCWIASTRSPSSRGAASPATAASACRPSATSGQGAGGCAARAAHAARTGSTGPRASADRQRSVVTRSLTSSPRVTVRGVAAARSSSSSRWRALGDHPAVARRRPRGRPGRAPAGWSCRPPWCARAGRAPSRAAIRASVCASTALVGSTSTSTGGSASSARASRSRCCWPPENSRPRSATTRVQPVGQRLDDVRRRWPRAAPPRSPSGRRAGGSSSSRSGPENRRASLSATRIRSRTVASGRSRSGTPDSVHLAVGRTGRAGRRSRPRPPGRPRRSR